MLENPDVRHIVSKRYIREMLHGNSWSEHTVRMIFIKAHELMTLYKRDIHKMRMIGKMRDDRTQVEKLLRAYETTDTDLEFMEEHSYDNVRKEYTNWIIRGLVSSSDKKSLFNTLLEIKNHIGNSIATETTVRDMQNLREEILRFVLEYSQTNETKAQYDNDKDETKKSTAAAPPKKEHPADEEKNDTFSSREGVNDNENAKKDGTFC